MGIKPYLLPSVLQLAMAQRLVRKLCDSCKKKIKPTPEIKSLILKEIDGLPSAIKKDIKLPASFEIFASRGCQKCGSAGYSGRIAVFEILSMTDSLAGIILKEPSEINILEEAKRQGMITMKQDGILKVLKGVTTIEEILRVAEEK
jgi:type IV pilus assembly protein PilB